MSAAKSSSDSESQRKRLQQVSFFFAKNDDILLSSFFCYTQYQKVGREETMRTLSIRQARRFLLLKNGLIGGYRFKGKQGALDYVR